MKHCLIMTVYKNVSLINYFISTMPDNFDLYIHVDAKSDIDITEINPRAKIIKKYNIYWGSSKHLLAVLDLLQMAFESNKYDYYHIITGQDFWASNPSQFDKILSHRNIYMDVFELSRENWWHGGLDILRYKTLSNICDVRHVFPKVINKLYMYVQYIFKLGKSLPSYALYGGSLYCSLPDYAVKEVLTSNISKDLIKRLCNTTCGEEIFFQTVLMNSPVYKKVMNNQLRYIDWKVQNGPKVLDESDFLKWKGKGYLFCRKINNVEVSRYISNILAI